jgi:hypothetical protein
MLEARAEPTATAGRILLHLATAVFPMESLCMGSVVVCIRPEDLQIETIDESADSPTQVNSGVIRLGRAAIIEGSVRGAHVRVIAEAGKARFVVLTSLSEWRRQGLQPGECGHLTVPADAIHLLELEAGTCR